MQKNLKILFGHTFFRPGLDLWYKEIIDTAPEGVTIEPFILTLNPPSTYLPWKTLDYQWQQKDKKLISMYRRLYDVASDYDIFINYNGINVHPEFLATLPTRNVYCCFDDPESSAYLGEYTASSYDAVFYGNIASLFQYESWGCKKLAWLPMFSSPNDFPPIFEKDELLNFEREIDIVFIGEKNKYKEKRLSKLKSAFPSALCYGRNGWDSPFVNNEDRDRLYRHSKIGWNIHNSTGPINLRLLMLAAYGVMQICDNKTGLGQIFTLDEEAVGFDTIPEAIELTNYYLAHDEERRRIARGGYQRFWNDYHPAAIWMKIIDQLHDWNLVDCEKKASIQPMFINSLQKQIKQKIEKPQLFAKRTWIFIKKIYSQRPYLEQSQQDLSTKSSLFDDSYYLGNTPDSVYRKIKINTDNMKMDKLIIQAPDTPDFVSLNWAATALIKDAKHIVELNSGVGAFAYYASLDKKRNLDCFEYDDLERNYAQQRCRCINVNFIKQYNDTLHKDYDLLVSFRINKHEEDLEKFLLFCSSLASRSILGMPNKLASKNENFSGSQVNNNEPQFSPGEFYSLLCKYYNVVNLFCMPDIFVPWLQPVTIETLATPIIAECKIPRITRKAIFPTNKDLIRANYENRHPT